MLGYNSKGELVFKSTNQPLFNAFSRDSYEAPFYLYDKAGLMKRAKYLFETLNPIEIFYALKANACEPLVRSLIDIGLGLDVVSLGEIEWGLRQGCTPQKMIFSGVGKSVKEITMALRLGIRQINVESLPELKRIAEIARELNVQAPVALRVNPDVDAETHPYIATGLKNNKFGIETEALAEAEKILMDHKTHLAFQGFSLHIGSQILELHPFQEALAKLRKIVIEWKSRGWQFTNMDAGGGLGIFYTHADLETEESLAQSWKQMILNEWHQLAPNFFVEPGRWLVAHSGVLITQVEYIKKTTHHQFVIVDTGMHHLLRPALYQAKHRIMPLMQNPDRKKQKYQIVGPICESSDVIQNEIELPEIFAGEYLAILDAGAYGATMASHYNKRSEVNEIFW